MSTLVEGLRDVRFATLKDQYLEACRVATEASLGIEQTSQKLGDLRQRISENRGDKRPEILEARNLLRQAVEVGEAALADFRTIHSEKRALASVLKIELWMCAGIRFPIPRNDLLERSPEGQG